MTNRTTTHRVASLAVAAVRKIWNEQGAAVDEIKEDYGEDLLVQTSLGNRMCSSRIWIQVKGTEKDCFTESSTLPSIPVKQEQMHRWIRSADLVIVVLWDVGNDSGWYAIPKDDFDPLSLLEPQKKTTRVKFRRESRFNIETAEMLVWRARLDHINRNLQSLDTQIEEQKRWGNYENTEHLRIMAADTLRTAILDLGIARQDSHWSSDFLHTLKLEMRKLTKVDDSEEALMSAIILAVSRTLRDHTGGEIVLNTLLVRLSMTVYNWLINVYEEADATE